MRGRGALSFFSLSLRLFQLHVVLLLPPIVWCGNDLFVNRERERTEREKERERERHTLTENAASERGKTLTKYIATKTKPPPYLSFLHSLSFFFPSSNGLFLLLLLCL